MVILQKARTNSILSPKIEKERGSLLKKLGSLLKEGYSIKDSLKFIEKFEKKEVKIWIKQLQEGLGKGHLFHEELAGIGYSNKVCSQIYFASKYGDYSQTIIRCGKDLLAQEKLKKRIRALLSYPFLLLFFLLLALFLMRFLVLPNMENLFFEDKSQINIYTNFLVSFIYYSPQFLLSVFFFIVITYLIIRRKLKKLSSLDQIKFFVRWPFIKKYVKNYWTSFIFLEWGQLLKKGISFHQLVKIMSEEKASPVLKETGSVLAAEMRQGKSIKDALKTLPFFEDEALIIVNHGENLGQLGIEMLFYASYCEENLIDSLEKLLERIQPIIFIFIALMIIAIYGSMILPIYTMMEGI